MTVGRKVAVGIGVAVVLIAGGLTYVLWPRGTTQVTEEDAVEDYRAQGDASDDGSPTSPAEGERGTPEPGVYTFAATGEEVVKLGPLPAETRPFPATVTAVAVDAGGGCFDWTLNLFAEHTEDTRWCTDPALRLTSHTKHQRIGALSPTATMSCDPDVVRPEDATDGTTADLSCRLQLSGSPASIAATLTGTATTGATETVVVGGDDVQATPVAVRLTVSGDLTGSWDETTWWTAEHLPVRIDRSLALSGLANFTETSKLELTSLEPSV